MRIGCVSQSQRLKAMETKPVTMNHDGLADARRGVLRRRAVGAHAAAVLLQLCRGSSNYAKCLRFAVAR